jgi:UDPglucose--hexose-1-phosphate uridylyltransferase
MNSQSELRYHSTTGEWVLICPKRGRRPNDFGAPTLKRVISSKRRCPLEEPQKAGNEIPHFWFPEDKPLGKWHIQVLPNKYPALTHRHMTCATTHRHGIYTVTTGVGHHDILITKDHYKNYRDLSDLEALNVLKAFVKRYKELVADDCMQYVSMFQNFGPNAGASLYHPHYQILALPVIPNTIGRSLSHSRDHWKEHKRCVHCDIIKQELREKKRIVYEKDGVIAFVPFASKEPYQVNIFPKEHLPYFEESSNHLLTHMSLALKRILSSIAKKLDDPDYNFYVHTSPITNKKQHKHYHWHLEVVPKSNVSAGFELGTGIEINPVYPEDAAKLIRLR